MKNDEGFSCLPEDTGVDLNRNYPLYWGISKTYDECKDKCGECYRGDSPLSEPET